MLIGHLQKWQVLFNLTFKKNFWYGFEQVFFKYMSYEY